MRRLVLLVLLAGCLPTEKPAGVLFRDGVPEMPVEKYGPVGGFVAGRLYVLGGDTGWGDGSLHVYDPADNEWSASIETLNGTAEWEAAVHDGTLYVCGVHPTGPQFRCESWDGTSWFPFPVPQGPRLGFTMVATDTHVYMLGGYEASQNEYGYSVDRFDPVARTWTRLPPLPVARQWSFAAFAGGRIWLYGHDPQFTAVSGLHSYEPGVNQWEAEGSWTSDDLYYARSGAVLDGKIWSISSPYLDPAAGSRIWTFDPLTGYWDIAGTLPETWFPWLTTDGVNVWILGGESLRQSGDPLARVEVFLP